MVQGQVDAFDLAEPALVFSVSTSSGQVVFELEKDCAELAIPALQAYREHTGARAGDFDDPEVLIEVGGDLIADLFHLARDAGLTPDALIDPALRHLHDETPHDSDEKNTEPTEPG
jgi:phage terminase small subunit